MASGAVHLMGNLAPVGKRHGTFLVRPFCLFYCTNTAVYGVERCSVLEFKKEKATN